MRFESSEPIFKQLYGFYKKLILNGVIKKDEYLPSVREVALEYKINPNTAARAYNLLIEDGLIISLQKKGYVVIYEEKVDKLSSLKEELNELLNKGYTKEEIINVLKELEK